MTEDQTLIDFWQDRSSCGAPVVADTGRAANQSTLRVADVAHSAALGMPRSGFYGFMANGRQLWEFDPPLGRLRLCDHHHGKAERLHPRLDCRLWGGMKIG